MLHKDRSERAQRGWRSTACAVAVLAATASPARDPLGVFNGWGAFRDARPARCYAIAEPAEIEGGGSGWKPFAAVATWPALGQRNQLHIRLTRRHAGGSPMSVIVGDRRFPLIVGGADAWAPDRAGDAAIVAAMRSALSMTVIGTGAGGRIRDVYRLQGAATAIDAAALGCAKLR